MVGGILDADEFAAIHGIIERTLAAGARSARAPDVEATPIGLIADDRAAQRAKPDSLRIANRWAPLARTRFARAFGLKPEVHVVGAEVAGGAFLREELPASWSRTLEIEGKRDLCVVCIQGPIIHRMTGHMLGGAEDDPEESERPPSIASLSVFNRAGEVFVGTLAEAWHGEQGKKVTALPESKRTEEWCRSLYEAEGLVIVNLGISGPAIGRLRVIAPPDAFVAPSLPARAGSMSPKSLEKVLGAIPVEVQVELGTVTMTMGEWAKVKPGTLITLPQTLDALLPVSIAGVPKLFGRPVISKGAMAVEIARPESNQAA